MKCPKCKHDVSEHDMDCCVHFDGDTCCSCAMNNEEAILAAQQSVYLTALAGIAIGVPLLSGGAVWVFYRLFSGR